MIVPISFANGSRYNVIRNILSQRKLWGAHFSGDTHPGVLFSGVQQNLTIFIYRNGEPETYTTVFNRFYNDARPVLFASLKYAKTKLSERGFLKLSSAIALNVIKKIQSERSINYSFASIGDGLIVTKDTTGSQYKVFFTKAPFFSVNGQQVDSSTFRKIIFSTHSLAEKASCFFNSNLFNLWWNGLSDGRHVTPHEIDTFPADLKKSEDNSVYEKLSSKLLKDIEKNGKKVVYQKANGETIYYQYNPRLSKQIIDEIDIVLAEHYGFTEEELDFIINYDIKYRMGEEINSED
jgi:hypothetical protein